MLLISMRLIPSSKEGWGASNYLIVQGSDSSHSTSVSPSTRCDSHQHPQQECESRALICRTKYISAADQRPPGSSSVSRRLVCPVKNVSGGVRWSEGYVFLVRAPSESQGSFDLAFLKIVFVRHRPDNGEKGNSEDGEVEPRTCLFAHTPFTHSSSFCG